MNCLWIVLVLSTLTGCLLTFVLIQSSIFLIDKYKESLFEIFLAYLQRRLSAKDLRAKLEEVDLEGELEPILEERIENWLYELTSRIPMGHLLVPQSLAFKIKNHAKNELLKAIPTIKEQLGAKIEESFDLQKLLRDSWQTDISPNLKLLIQNTTTSYQRLLLGVGALLGFLLGWLEFLVLWFFCWNP